MNDSELIKLRKIKSELLAKIYDMKDRLQEKESSEYQPPSILNLNLPVSNENLYSSQQESSNKLQQKLCQASQHVSGLTFKNVEKNWLHSDIYCYKANVITKAFQFYLELTVDCQDTVCTEILDITCHFIGLDHCYILELTPWVQDITRMKHFSFFMTTISDYSEHFTVRLKILNNSKICKHISVKELSKNGGGLKIYVHPIDKEQKTVLRFHWSLVFVEKTTRIEHFFTIKPTENGEQFAKEHCLLLEEFCKKHVTKNELNLLWSKLCSAIDSYENI